MRIHIPNSAFIGNIESFLRKISTFDDKQLSISFNQKWISVHPVVLSTVAALAIYCRENNIPVHVYPVEARSGHYLQTMGLLEMIGSDQNFPFTSHEPTGRFIKLTRITNSDDLSEFITDMIPLLHATPDEADPIKYVMSEIIRNVLEHSASNMGAIVCAQYFKKTNRVAIGIADCGIGIKGSMDYSWKTSSHADAIKLALMPGITGTTKHKGGTELNAGAGLFFTKSIAKVSGDYFMIYSGDTLYKLQKSKTSTQLSLFPDPLMDRNSIKSDLPFFQGTSVGVDFSMDVNTKFANLLLQIEDAYQVSRKRKHKKDYKKPKFV